MTRAPNGAGTIEPLGSGRFSVRLTVEGQRRRLGPYATREEAEKSRDAALLVLAEEEERAAAAAEEARAAKPGPVTLRTFGARWLADRERSGDYRSVRSDRGRWRLHVETAPFIDWPLVRLTPLAIAEWAMALTKKQAATPRAAPRLISRKTCREALTLLRTCLDHAIAPHGILAVNPAARVKIRPERRPYDPWTYLEPHEQRALLECPQIPESDRLIIAFALGSGLRQGEQFNLELRDLHVGEDPHVVVRFGSKGEVPKNGRIRHVPLFGLALDAARRWLEILPSYAPENPERLVFPGPHGGRRARGKHLYVSRTVEIDGKRKAVKVNLFQEYLLVAGIVPEKRHDGRPVRWHDGRHTCGASLAAGWWGHPWRLEEIRDMLGHSSIQMTQRYAHLARSVVRAAAERTPGLRPLPTVLPTRAAQAPIPLLSVVGRQGLEPWTYGLKGGADRPDGPISPSRARGEAAIAFLRGAATQEGGALAVVLAGEVLRAAGEVPAAWVRLALEVRDGDRLWGAKAAELALAVLDAAQAGSAGEGSA